MGGIEYVSISFFGVKHFAIGVSDIKHEREEKIEANLYMYIYLSLLHDIVTSKRFFQGLFSRERVVGIDFLFNFFFGVKHFAIGVSDIKREKQIFIFTLEALLLTCYDIL